VTMLACRMKLMHYPCDTPKEVFTSRSEPDDDLSVSRDDFSVSRENFSVSHLIHCPCGAPKVFTLLNNTEVHKQK
jgi:hypothetical protein